MASNYGSSITCQGKVQFFFSSCCFGSVNLRALPPSQSLCYSVIYLDLTVQFLAIRFGDDWKKCLELPPKDTRLKTSVSLLLVIAGIIIQIHSS